MSNANAATLRTRINALGHDLAHCSSPAETRAVKLEIRTAELALTALAAPSVTRIVAGSVESSAFRGASRRYFERKTVFAGALGAI